MTAGCADARTEGDSGGGVRRPSTVWTVLTVGITAALVAVTSLSGTSARAEGLGSAPAAAAGATGATVTVTGSGFGHGVGMSQFGALGMAKAGASTNSILRHYYSGTTVARYPDNVDLRVNVVDRGTSVALRTEAIADGGGAMQLVDGGRRVTSLGPGAAVRVTLIGGRLRVGVTPPAGQARSFTTGALTVRWSGARGLRGPASVLAVSSDGTNEGSTASKQRRYRHGALRLVPVRRTNSASTGRTRIAGVLTLNLHREYLRGIAEVPQSWHSSALKAQVTAARTYALSEYRGGTSTACGGCHLWDDQRSQVYRGWDAERVAPRWVKAVAATQTSSTRALVVLHRGRPIRAYYSSSSGGRTRDARSTWGTAVPYLRGAPDPWSIDGAINPRFARWRRTVPMATVTSVFGLPDVASIAVTRKDRAGAALAVTATSADGRRATVSGARLRSKLRLPAVWYRSFELS